MDYEAEIAKAQVELERAKCNLAKAKRRYGYFLFFAQCLASFMMSMTAYFFAIALGVEPWRDSPIGDAADIGVTFGFAVYFILEVLRGDRQI